MTSRRDYHGSPLAYFREVYGNSGLSRGELADIDSRLYRALLRHEQMDLAIPQKNLKGRVGRRGLSPGIINDILEAHEIFGASATEAERHLPASDKTIIRVWRAHELPILKGKPKQTISYRH